MNVVFDFDGTLIDARPRVYEVFQSLVPVSELSFDDYWALKRSGIGHEQILKDTFFYSDTDFKRFSASWLKEIERPTWLALDTPFEGVTQLLNDLCGHWTLYLATSRQSKAGVLDQIRTFGWEFVFKNVLVTEHSIEKTRLISCNMKLMRNDWFVGDTGHDILVGKELGVRTAAVLSGFLSRDRLMEYQPDVIIDSVLGLRDWTKTKPIENE